MELKEAINIFDGVMDQDSADIAIQQGDYRTMVNGVTGITNQKNNGNVENTPGTALVANPIGVEPGSYCVGIKNSPDNVSVYYLNHSPTGKHGIYKYTKDVIGMQNGKIETVLVVKNEADYTELVKNPLDFKKDYLVTGAAVVNNELVFTDDNTSPKAIDIPRAMDNKNRRFKIVFNQNQLNTTSTYTLNIYNPSIANPAYVLTWSSSADTVDERAQDFINAVNNSTAYKFFKLINCNTHPIIEMLTVEEWAADIVETSLNLTTYQSVVLPNNFYPQKNALHLSTYELLQTEHIDYVKYLPKCMPTLIGGIDPSRVNLLSGKLFQFRVRYNYINNHKSRLGAISTVYIPSVICGQTNLDSQDNYIDVNFNDPFLENKSFAWLVESVDIIVRDHATNQWIVCENILQEKFAGANNQKYRFYNDTSAKEIIGDIDLNEQFDNVPLLAKSLEFAENIVFMGGITEGYDKPCIDAKIDVLYPDDNSTPEETYSICGIICIRNIYQTDSRYQAHQPIWDNDSGKIGWGGIGKIGLLGNASKHFDTTQKVQMFAGDTGTSLRGFTMYLAGTEYYAVSEQHNGSNNSALQYGAKNVVEITTKSAIKDANDSIEVTDLSSLLPFGNTVLVTSADNGAMQVGDNVGNGVFFSRFEIRDVKPGKYILRCASPSETTAAMLSSGGLDYQNTSAPMLKVGGYNGYEMVVTVGAAQAQLNPQTGRKTVFVAPSAIADMTDPDEPGLAHRHVAKIIHGYMIDADGTVATSFNDALKGKRLAGGFIIGKQTGTPLAGIFAPNNMLAPRVNFTAYQPSIFNDAYCYTDHNGFFFISMSGNESATFTVENSTASITQRCGTHLILSSPTLNNQGGAFVSTNADDIITAQFNEPVEISTNRRTTVAGRVVKTDGVGIPNMGVVLRGTPYAITDIEGYFKIFIYPDTSIADTSSTNLKVVSGEVTTVSKSCVAKSVPGNNNYIQINTINVPFNPPPVQYNDDQILTLADFVFSLPNGKESISAWKPGSDEQFGLVYYDKAHRRCAVVTEDKLKAHILFYNEQEAIDKKLPETPRQIAWQIFHDPPIWADHYQWVRTKNLQHGAWLQWCINKVKFVDDNFTDVTSQNAATYLELDFDNISYYVLNKYKNAIIAAPFVKGDRIRFIKDAGGNTITQYADLEIENIIGNKYYVRNTNKIQVLEGMLVELYQKKQQDNDELYYEFGECYAVKWGVFNGSCKKYHEGQTQHQAMLPFPMTGSIPATGIFKTGNAYFRKRNIPVNVISATQASPQSGTGSNYLTYAINDGSVSDFYLSDNDNTGRVNTEALKGRTLDYSDMRFSDNYVQGTNTNGINTFRALNKKVFNKDYGKLNKLQLINSTILYAVFHNSYTVSMYLNQSVLRDLTGQKIVAISDDIVPRTTEMQRTFGTQHPATIIINDEGDLFGYDENKGVAWRASGNGLADISSIKMKRWFKLRGQERAARITKSVVIGGYDMYRDSYMLTMIGQQSQEEILPKTKICLPDYQYTGGSFVVKGEIQPSGLTLFTYPLSGTGSTINTIIPGLQAIGFTVVQKNCNCIEVTAPNMGLANQNINIIAEFTDLIINNNSTFSSAGQWILGNFWSINTNRLQYASQVLNYVSESKLDIPMLVAGNYTLSFDIVATGAAYNLEVIVGGMVAYNAVASTSTQAILLTLTGTPDKEIIVRAKAILNSTDFVAIDNIKLTSSTKLKQLYSFTFDAGQIKDNTPSTNGYTLGFSKLSPQVSKQGWKSFYSFYPEMYACIRNIFILIQGGELHTLNSTLHNTFFNVKYLREVEYVVNPEPDATKGFKAVAQYCDNRQDMPALTIAPNAEYPTGMTSLIPINRLEINNGMFYSETLMDMTTPGFTSTQHALLNGRDLQGKEMTVKITDDNYSASVLRYLKTIYFYIFKS